MIRCIDWRPIGIASESLQLIACIRRRLTLAPNSPPGESARGTSESLSGYDRDPNLTTAPQSRWSGVNSRSCYRSAGELLACQSRCQPEWHPIVPTGGGTQGPNSELNFEWGGR
jgi:hypothetical protein